MVISEAIWSVVIYLVWVYQRMCPFGGTHTHTCGREQLHGLNLRERNLQALSHQSSPSSSLLRRLTTIIMKNTSANPQLPMLLYLLNFNYISNS